MNIHAVAAVARWEYRRFAKPRDLLLSVLFFAVAFGVFGFVNHYLEGRSQRVHSVAVWGGEHMGLESPLRIGRFELEPHSEDLGALEESLDEDSFDALLVVTSPLVAELRVREERAWQLEFLSHLTARRQQQRPAELGLAPDVVTALSEPLLLSRLEQQPREETQARAGTWTVIILIGTMLMGLLTGFSYVFVAITSEKTQKVTESVLSAITPQEWIDGKIIGLTLVVAVNLLAYVLGYGVYKAVMVLFLDAPFQLPSGAGEPLSVLWLALFSLLGYGFWFTFFAVVAATISDPNTSSRSSMMFLPFLPLVVALAGMDEPNALWMRVLSWIPGVSPTAMPVRLLRGEPALLEVVVSLLLLLIMVGVFRRAAGRVFGVSMLMTGKEPSWREVLRWMREA